MNKPISTHPKDTIKSVSNWLKSIVIGLNFCPFARKPFETGKVRIVCVDATEDDAILTSVLEELNKLEACDSDEIETTLIALTHSFQDFNEFNSLLHVLDEVIEVEGFEGIFQIASFHPNYQFADTHVDDVSNYTNRAPFPILHVLREDSLSAALDNHPDPDAIPEKNIQRLRSFSNDEIKRYFHYLFEK